MINNTKRLDDVRVMTPMDLVRAVLAVYPPEASADSRSGGLAGEPSRSSVTGQRGINAPNVQVCNPACKHPPPLSLNSLIRFALHAGQQVPPGL